MTGLNLKCEIPQIHQSTSVYTARMRRTTHVLSHTWGLRIYVLRLWFQWPSSWCDGILNTSMSWILTSCAKSGLMAYGLICFILFLPIIQRHYTHPGST